MEKKFSGQSYRWPAFTIAWEGDSLPATFSNVKLLKTEAGNLTKLQVVPDGEWHGIACSRSGEFSISKNSRGDVVLALASSGSWSGGGNYSGYIFGKPGAIVWFRCKGRQEWLVFSQDGCAWQDIAPGAVPKEL